MGYFWSNNYMEDEVFSDAMLSKTVFIFGKLVGVFEGKRIKVNVIQLVVIQHKSQVRMT